MLDRIIVHYLLDGGSVGGSSHRPWPAGVRRSGAGLAVEVKDGTICFLLLINPPNSVLARPPCVGPIGHKIINYSLKKVHGSTSLVVLQHKEITLLGCVLRPNHLADGEEAMDAQEKRDDIEDERGDEHQWLCC